MNSSWELGTRRNRWPMLNVLTSCLGLAKELLLLRKPFGGFVFPYFSKVQLGLH